MAKYYQVEIETASREQIDAWQNERLVKQVQHVWDNVPYYRKKMEEKGLTPADIQGTADLHKLPFLTKDDIDLWEDCCARAIVAVGGGEEDVCQVAYGYGLFTGGAGLHGGSHKVVF